MNKDQYWTVFNSNNVPGQFYVGLTMKGADIMKDKYREENGLVFDNYDDAYEWMQWAKNLIYEKKNKK